MIEEVKKCVDNHDIKGLHYIFFDCLDVDPTFDNYREDYLYCKKLEGFFDSHVEMTPILSDRNRWNMAYWELLKLDLVKNFSQRRFEHMIQVAKVIYADKIERLLAERESKKESVVEAEAPSVKNNPEEITKTPVTVAEVRTPVKQVKEPIDKQQEDLLAKKRALELQNQQIERMQQEQRARIAAARRAEAEKKATVQRGQGSKKVAGITLATLAIIVFIVVLVLIKVL